MRAIYLGRRVNGTKIAYTWANADNPEQRSLFPKGPHRVVGGLYDGDVVFTDGWPSTISPRSMSFEGIAENITPEQRAEWEAADRDAYEWDERRKAEKREQSTGLVRTTAERVVDDLGLAKMSYRGRQRVLSILMDEIRAAAEKGES